MSIPAGIWECFLLVHTFIVGKFEGLHMPDGRWHINSYSSISLRSRNYLLIDSS